MRWIWFLAILSVLGANACGAFNDNYSKEFHGDSIHDTSPCNSFSYMTLQSLEPMQIISIIFLGDGQGKHGQINLEENEDDEEQAVRNDNGSPTIQSAKTGHSDLKDDQLKRLFNGIIGYGNDPEAFDLAGKQAMDEINVENTEIEFNYDTNSNCGGRGYVDVFTKYDKNDDDKFCVAGDGHDLGRNVDVYRKKVCKQHGTGTGGDDEGRNEMEEDLTNIFGNYGDSVQDMFFCVDADYIHVDGEGVNEQTDLLDAGLMEINEDEEEEDEEQEVRNNNLSPTTQSAQTSDSDPTDDQLKRLFNGMNCYGDDPSRSTLENFDYSYDAKGDDNDEDDMETGSVQFHSSPDEDDDDEDGGGSARGRTSAEEKDEKKVSDGGGSMQMHPEMENNEDWFGDDTQNRVYDDEDDDEDDDGSEEGGSGQMNDIGNDENCGAYTILIMVLVYVCFGQTIQHATSTSIFTLLFIPSIVMAHDWSHSSSLSHHDTTSANRQEPITFLGLPPVVWMFIIVIIVLLCCGAILLYCIRDKDQKNQRGRERNQREREELNKNPPNQEIQMSKHNELRNRYGNKAVQSKLSPIPADEIIIADYENEYWIYLITEVYRKNKMAIQTQNKNAMKIDSKHSAVLLSGNDKINGMIKGIREKKDVRAQQGTREILEVLKGHQWGDDDGKIINNLSFILDVVAHKKMIGGFNDASSEREEKKHFDDDGQEDYGDEGHIRIPTVFEDEGQIRIPNLSIIKEN